MFAGWEDPTGDFFVCPKQIVYPRVQPTYTGIDRNREKGRRAMDRTELYRDIAMRTQGDIYIGVVGPVRTGKSTFIKRFMELLVLPQIGNAFACSQRSACLRI